MKESKEYIGYFHTPIYDDILISHNFNIKSIQTKKNLRLTEYKQKNYIRIRATHDIYLGGNKKITKSYSFPRIIASTFIGRPIRLKNIDYKYLQVNHINGDTTNNSLVNLEWVTNLENIEHREKHFSGIRYKMVLARNILTEEVMNFKSIAECSRYFNIPKNTLHYHLFNRNIHKGVKNNFIFKLNDNSPWYDFNINNLYEICKGSNCHASKRISAMNLFTKDIKIFNSNKECSDYFNIDSSLLSKCLNNFGKKHKNGWIFKYTDDNSVWNLHDINELINFSDKTH